ncbi:MAG TPA: hypothetical protein VL025_02015 [Thermoanaerobaculia bacterium]|nr:hypothetical protein [Thermoanaerobaculia bacterium]
MAKNGTKKKQSTRKVKSQKSPRPGKGGKGDGDKKAGDPGPG